MKKISTRIIALLGILVFFICFGFGIVSYTASYNSLIDVLEETMPKVAQEASITIEDGIQNQLNKLEIIASLEYMRVLNESNPDTSTIRSIMSAEAKRSAHKQMILIDRNGNALYDDGRVAVMPNNIYYKKALSGENVISEPMIDNASNEIIIYYAVPVRVDNEVVGVLMAVRDGLELSEFAARIKFGETGEAFIIDNQGKTIAHADKELLLQIVEVHTADESSSASVDATSSASVDATTSASENNEQSILTEIETSESSSTDNSKTQLGFEGFSDIQEKMMKGQKGFGEYEYNGVAKVSGFAPIEKFQWSIAVTIDKEEALSGLSGLKQTFLLISSVFLLAGLIIAYFIGTSISKPISHLAHHCKIISNGDFSKNMEERYTKRHDEIGDLARGFNNININVSKIIRNVVSEAGSVSKAIENVNNNMSGLTDEIDHMSGIIGRLSSKMDETSAMAEEMHAASSEIEGAIDSISDKSQKGAQSAKEVSKRAENLKNNAIESQKRAQDIQLDVAIKLREAIEKSKAVEKIKILSDVILDISSQTNLLALNATIEASQAGNAGSGFAVVAGEIRNLADHTKQTVNEIQKVTKQVIESVEALSTSSEQVLEFLEEKVVKDYNMLVETGEQYNEDAQLITEMVADLNKTTEQLYSSIKNMVKAINDVAAASEEGASETADLANEATLITRRTKEVLEKTYDVNKSAGKLLDLVSIFKT
ncbi:MAG: methyl-accepting chemotaxis protein [Clostridiales bacterium]|nr:methyl-accepting chemotaxis protein [Clostridiales bacterium]